MRALSEREIGELIGSVRNIAEKLSSLESANRLALSSMEAATRQGFNDTQTKIDKLEGRIDRVEERVSANMDKTVQEWQARIERLERWRYAISGAISLLGFAIAYGLVKGFSPP